MIEDNPLSYVADVRIILVWKTAEVSCLCIISTFNGGKKNDSTRSSKKK